ncbi:CBS domain-containing protein [Bacillus pakistanensis]|uniref:CBS domain-containing protein n=1 Tax=Rossellomorea pakistanensis TaxID=992288 RepID=A0ABS2N897_9BACI|nr:DUF294 nucleotidyltransferase-like domain-containing protein [Bacillus pakistanensis]MBM7584076.1 CBS domain-containing protein [Bacillus pakistanensis]
MNNEELYQMIKNHYPFDVLTNNQLLHIISRSRFTTFAKNEFLFHEDETVNDLDIYFLVSGLAKNVLHRSNGKQFSLRYYYPGDLVGLMIMLTSGGMTFSVQALEDCTVFRFNKSDFFEVMTENKEFSKIVFESIGSRMKSLYDELQSTSWDDEENISLFSTKVNTLMESPVFIRSTDTIKNAASIMNKHNVTGLVVSEDGKKLDGIITHRELLKYVSGDQDRKTVREWMIHKPFWIRDEAFAYEALSYFKHEDIEFVPILRYEKVVGILTSHSFLNIQDSKYLDLSYRIQTALTTDDLVALSPSKNCTFHQFIRDILDQGSLGYDVCEIITNYNDRLHRRIIQLTEKEMRIEGYGRPPINYCFIVMGSQGRGEQSFHTDQDNGIILDDYLHFKDPEKVEAYFQHFTEKLNVKLSACGFPECTGGIMARELKWRKSFSQWKDSVHDWLHEMDAEEVQSFTMFFDFRPIYGDYSLAQEIRSMMVEKAKNSLTMQQLLRKDAIRFKVPVNALGRINLKPKSKVLNLKKSGMMQIINMIRIHSIKYGIKDVNTVKRLQSLEDIQAFHPRDVQNAKTALHHFMTFRLNQNLLELEEKKQLSNEISLLELSKEDKRKLKEALQIANRMQQVLEISFNRNRVV